MLGDAKRLGKYQSGEFKLIYIIGTYPTLSTTFIDREIMMLRRLGVDLQILSIRQPSPPISPDQEALRQGVQYLFPIDWSAFLKSHLWFAVRQPKKFLGTLLYLQTRRHRTVKSFIKTLLHFAEGVFAAFLLRDQRWNHVHAHFADRATTVALIVGRLLDLPFSFTAHANDIYVDPVLLEEKISQASFVATCTRYNHAHLAQLGGSRWAPKIRCIYHGLDSDRYQGDVSLKASSPIVLSVGQLKEKKGFSYLIKACARLRELGYNLQCQIVGEGLMRKPLEAEIRELELEDLVTLCGALPHEDVIQRYHQATLFVLPAILGADGDRDGIPNVILEAMASGLPVIATRHSGIPEVIEDGCNGRLVPPADEDALAKAIAELLDDSGERSRLSEKAFATIADQFDLERQTLKLLDAFVQVG